MCWETVIKWMPQDLSDKSTLVQVMTWCHQATSHYLSQYWLRSMSPYSVTRPQWVNTIRARPKWLIFFIRQNFTSISSALNIYWIIMLTGSSDFNISWMSMKLQVNMAHLQYHLKHAILQLSCKRFESALNPYNHVHEITWAHLVLIMLTNMKRKVNVAHLLYQLK